jgi:hypothetical protein
MGVFNNIRDNGYSVWNRLKDGGSGQPRRGILDRVWGTDKKRTILITVLIISIMWLGIVKIGFGTDKLIYLSVFIIAIGLLLTYPYWGIIIIMFTDVAVPFYSFKLPIIGIGVPFSKFFGLFVLLAFIINYTIRGKILLIGDRKQFFFLYLFTITGVLSSFNAFSFKEARLEVIRLFLLTIFYVITFNLIDNPKKVYLFNYVILVGVFITCFRSVYEAFLLHEVRPTGGTGNPIGLTIAANLGFALLLVLFLELKTGVKRLFLFIGLLITAGGVFISNARAGFVALFFTLFFQFVRKRKVYINYLIIISVLIVLLNIIPDIYTYRPGEFVSRVYEQGLAGLEREPRFALYRASVDLFLKNPLLGVGPWGFRHIYYKEYAEKYRGPRYKLVPHSGILGLLAEFGFFAFVFFAGYVIATAYIFRKSVHLAESLDRPGERIAVLTAEAAFWAFFVIGVFQDIAAYRPSYVFPAIGAAMYYRLLAISKESNGATERLSD